MEEGRYDQAEEMYRRVQGPLREFSQKIEVRSGGQARSHKGLMAIMGRPVGASRPPSKPLNAEEMGGAETNSRRLRVARAVAGEYGLSSRSGT